MGAPIAILRGKDKTVARRPTSPRQAAAPAPAPEAAPAATSAAPAAAAPPPLRPLQIVAMPASILLMLQAAPPSTMSPYPTSCRCWQARPGKPLLPPGGEKGVNLSTVRRYGPSAWWRPMSPMPKPPASRKLCAITDTDGKTHPHAQSHCGQAHHQQLDDFAAHRILHEREYGLTLMDTARN